MIEVTAIVQARMGSSRLPGKVLKEIAGKTVLGHLLDRLKRSERLKGIIVAISDSDEDRGIAAEAEARGVGCFRGSEHDVLDRFYQAAAENNLKYIARITGDCPLYDPNHLDDLILILSELNKDEVTVDYLTNCTVKRTFPRGTDSEIFTFEALETTWREAVKKPHREHVTPFIYSQPGRFRLHSVESAEDLSKYRLTLDAKEDLELLRILIEKLDGGEEPFRTEEVVKFLKEQPELLSLNAAVEQKHGENKF